MFWRAKAKVFELLLKDKSKISSCFPTVSTQAAARFS